MAISRKLKDVAGYLWLSFILALAILVNVYPVWRWHRQRTLDAAPTVHGQVLRKSSNTSTRGTPSYWVTYTYEARGPGGRSKSYEADQIVQPHIYDQAREGSEITVHYLPSDPSVSSIDGNFYSMGYWFLACIIVDCFFLFIVFVILRDVVRRRRRK